MKHSLKLITLLALIIGVLGVTPAYASKPTASSFVTLGVYPAAATALNGNITVTPSVAPDNAKSIAAYTSTEFKGTFAVNAAGVVTVTNAHPAGVYTVTVKAYGTSDVTATFNLTVNTGTTCTGICSFTNAANVNVGSNNPSGIAIGDFNGDGNQDFATANSNANTVSIRLGNGLGGFSSVADVGVDIGPASTAIGDFNNDGKPDFVTANQTASTASIRLGDGLGGFSGTTNVSVGAAAFVTIGDFNGDGNQDFATANSTANTVSIRLGDGIGGFSGTTNVSVGYRPLSVAIGDFNEDGMPDFATANYDADTVSIRLGDGLGGFSGTTNVSVGSDPFSVAIGDFDQDGKQDFATANYGANTVSIRLGDGLGGFSGALNVSVGSDPYSVAIGDFNQDGNQDFASANGSANTVSIRLGDGFGKFNGTTNIAVGALPSSIAIGDFDEDGTPDFATANYQSSTVSIRLGVCLYTVTFDANGGSGSMTPQVASVAQNLTVNSFTRSGYTFTGWNTADNGSGNAYADGASYPFTENATLYAQWLANPTATPTVTVTPTVTATATGTPVPPTATATRTATATATSLTQTLKSIAAEDGWVLESSETSGAGGTMNGSASIFRLGDEAGNQQYRSILSFNTGILPDTAVIQSAVLKIKQNGVAVGTNPFTVLGSVWVDMRAGLFGTGAIELTDFNSPATVTAVNAFNSTPVSTYYTLTLGATGRNTINTLGRTQFRLRFGVDDNNNLTADYMKFLTGEFAGSEPQLTITYIVP